MACAMTFFRVDADSDGQITQRDVDLHTLMEGVQARNLAINNVSATILMAMALSGRTVHRDMTYDLRGQLGLAAFNKTRQARLPPLTLRRGGQRCAPASTISSIEQPSWSCR